jgi:eukaryotic-like serine/threonine-protein kinase
MSAAERLQGLVLDDKWTVQQRIESQPSSGGFFSVPYLVQDEAGKQYFLKAFDFSTAFRPGSDVVRVLQMMTAAYEHERDILDYCKARRLSGVVVAVSHGYVQVPGTTPMEGTVYYLVFELATTDVRRQVDAKSRLDSLWCLKILDDVTLGLWQLHRESIAHQDTKPSNVLVYPDDRCRVGDFGRSSRRGKPIWTDDLPIAGDKTYAPPELLYSYVHPDFIARRVGCDLYLLGNLAAFLFSGVNMTAGLLSRLDQQFHPTKWGGTYEQVLPYVQKAFELTVQAVAPQVDDLVREEIVTIIRELCEPDLSRRGHPRGIGKFDQYSLERYKSRFDLLAKQKAIAARIQKTA